MAWERRRWCWKSSPVGPPSFRWRGKLEVVGGAGAGTEVGGGRDRRRRAGGVYLSVSVVVMVVSLAPAHPRPLPARAPAFIGLKPGGEGRGARLVGEPGGILSGGGFRRAGGGVWRILRPPLAHFFPPYHKN